jgi:hypothetical protein
MAAYTVNTYQVTSRAGLNQAIGTTSTTQLHPLGDRVTARDVSGTRGEGEFIYLQGLAGVAAGQVCLITDAWGVSLIAARDKGAVAIATAAIVASNYGWFQIKGQAMAICAAAVAANAPLYIAAANVIDDAVVAGDCILGMRSVTAQDTATVIVNMACNPSCGDFDNA